MSSVAQSAPPDQAQRERALDPQRSVLVQAPAGSGKTDLLTRRFLRLLGEVNDPSQIVAITFTKAAAAEMRHRIISELEKATQYDSAQSADDEFSMHSLAHRALRRSSTLGWDLLNLPGQLRISTIDSFCRELAIQQPLLSGLGGTLDVSDQPQELYRRAARRTLQQLSQDNSLLNPAIEALLLWRDNGWQEMENQLVQMLEHRDRWMQDFVLDRDPDWDQLRTRLEQPFVRALSEGLDQLASLLGHVPGACDEAMELARFACAASGRTLHRDLAERAEFPCGPFNDPDDLEDTRQAHLCLAQLLLTNEGAFRKSIDKRLGFPADRKAEKQRMLKLIEDLAAVPGLEDALARLQDLPPARYSEEDWEIVRACFSLLRHAAGELRVAFAEAGAVDFSEVAQVAQRVLQESDGMPTDAALAIADGIRHLLVDEFQDTSRRQHRLLSSLVAAWPDPHGRTVFVVGDPMQSIYFFRDADAELFPRVQTAGLELPGADPLFFDFVPLASNFRTAPALVNKLNETFTQVFAANDGSGITFSPAEAARPAAAQTNIHFDLHLDFVPQPPRNHNADPDSARQKQEALAQREQALEKQTARILDLIRSHMDAMDRARTQGAKYRIAVLGRTRNALAPVAAALRDAAIPFRAIDLEPLAERPEILDVLALVRALFYAEDRVAWLGVLRAPWSGLSLEDIHTLTSSDEPEMLRRTIPELLESRGALLSSAGQHAGARVLDAMQLAAKLRATRPTLSLGSWAQQVWHQLGGADCVDATGRANLELLWACLDSLPNSEADALGPAMDQALAKLTAQPDPAVSAEIGVQLMTIHKSKGLEFEVVIVPELQAACSRTTGRLLSWLERGLATPAESRDITEFLVAPLQPKGSDRGKAKAWVDHVYRAREMQEMRRILYVAATRAREELHLFARPSYKADSDGELVLCDPTESLLSTAWPALQHEVQQRFESWRSQSQETELETIAAAAGPKLVSIASESKPAMLRRLPADYVARAIDLGGPQPDAPSLGSAPFYTRHEGGMLSRALGIAVHACFEELARLRSTLDWESARTALREIEPRTFGQARSVGVAPTQAAEVAAQALDIVLRASHDLIAEWILSPHPQAASELRWAGVIDDTVRNVQVDRIFCGGPKPLAEGDEAWWIVDYKTAHTEGSLAELRVLFAPQLEQYARVLRLLRGEVKIRAGLYYPRMQQFDWWEIQ